ncbi:sensor histidine kinase, partial [Candidatus Roizmanbacteria bacterium]|nr:sensor histidine kinase [Candidatus Roizmanbacteria bacterium]
KSQVYIYRIAQEALNNITKHARATEVVIKLSRINNIVSLEVSDNGKGFIFDPVCFAQRNGLQNMLERTHLLDGEFIINSQPGKGTTIKVSIPYTTGNGKDQTDFGG